MRGELWKVGDARVCDVRFVRDDHGIAVTCGELERKLDSPQRAGRIVRQREEHHARMVLRDRRLDRRLVELEVSVQRHLDRRQAARDRGELVVDEARRRDHHRSRERIAQHRDQLVGAVAEHQLGPLDAELPGEDRAQLRRLRIRIAFERHLGERGAELRAQLGRQPVRQLVRIELRDHARRLRHVIRGTAAQGDRHARRERTQGVIRRSGHLFPRISAERPWPSRPSHAASAAIGAAWAAAAAALYSTIDVRLRKSWTPSGDA